MVAEVQHVGDGHLEQLGRSLRPGDIHELDEAHDVGSVGPASVRAVAAIDPGLEDFPPPTNKTC